MSMTIHDLSWKQEFVRGFWDTKRFLHVGG